MSHAPGHEGGPGIGGADIVGPAGAEFLPFSGSILMLPVALLGLFLTLAGWVLTRFGGEDG